MTTRDCKYQDGKLVTESDTYQLEGKQCHHDIYPYVSIVAGTGDCYHVPLTPYNPDKDRLYLRMRTLGYDHIDWRTRLPV